MNNDIIEEILEYKPKKLLKSATKYDVYITLTSSPERLDKVISVLNLLDIRYVKEIHINLPKFYRNDKKLVYKQSHIDNLKKSNPKIKIFRLKDDLGPITKILPTIERIKKNNSLIISIDDDIAYPFDMITDLINNSAKYPNNIICMSGFIFGGRNMKKSNDSEYYEQADWDRYLWPVKKYPKFPYIDVLEGFSGVCYNRSLINDQMILYIKYLNSLCKLSDDLTISYMFSYFNIPIRSLGRHSEMIPLPYGEEGESLHGGGDDDIDMNFIKYGECLKIINVGYNK